MTTLFVVVALLSAGSAQAHPCDQASQTGQAISSGAPHKLQLCGKAIDQPEAATVYVNGVASDLRPITPVTGTSSTGEILYEVALGQFAKGSYVVEASLWNTPFVGATPQEGAKSSPFSFTVEDDLPPPSAPVIKGIVR